MKKVLPLNVIPEAVESVDMKMFARELRNKVFEYFKEKNISSRGGWQLHLKSYAFLALYVTGYIVLLLDVLGPYRWFLWAFMGVLMAGIGMCVMHDASHKAFSKYQWFNRMMGWSIHLIGGFIDNWVEQHAVRHHTYTNVDPRDEDVAEIYGVLRFHPETEWKPGHRIQFVTAWFLYLIMNLQWVLWKDYFQLARHNKENNRPKAVRREKWTRLIILKVLYFFFWIGLPILMGQVWYHVVLGWTLMVCVSGFILSVVFQMAHVVEGCHFFAEPTKNKVTGSFREIHQLLTTANFKTWWGWYMGGLDHQIEHHLFPMISHIHYPKIAPIVQSVCEKYGVPYNQYGSWWQAMVGHQKMLIALGKLS